MSGPGLLVTLDGMAGAGKTTTAHLVAEQLQLGGHTALYTCEPTDSPLGRFVREHFPTITGHALACMVAADRHEHLTNVIDPAINQTHIVICDRYLVSSLVLQPLDAVPAAYVQALNAPMRQPDLAIVLSASPHIAWTRIARRGRRGRFESSIQELHTQHNAYRQVAAALTQHGWNMHIIDTSDTAAAAVADQIAALIAATAPAARPTA
ncbi:dTMP kinase [Mycobacterium sp. D16R24]|uniref:dTMP kinase n=1 Tax=Mycobacterium sp. D16R24 TaxID=1855656 RepID=UPI000992AB4A|nr:dTMP kinase [Mycobacterium sp. D16R24]